MISQSAGARGPKFQMELEKIRQTHAAKENFLPRLAKANL
jgi:hypothetical protein